MATTKLSQLLALFPDAKERSGRAFGRAKDMLHGSKPGLNGHSRTYEPLAEGDSGTPESDMPDQYTRVQYTVMGTLTEMRRDMERLFDLVSTMEHSNTQARADVMVDGKVLLAGVPVTVLLFLERQLLGLDALFRGLPVLDEAHDWHRDQERAVWRTDPQEKYRTAKTPYNHPLAPPTKEHKEQVELLFTDRRIGTYREVHFSGALARSEARDIQDRVRDLLAAVKVAREEANSSPVHDQPIGVTVFSYLLG
jgi:hypothetical protein